MSKNDNINKLVSIEIFKEERPAMVVFQDEEIQEAILSSFNLINGECANLPLQVLNYNIGQLEPIPVPPSNASDLYRTEFELDQFRQAVITQTQYTLNMGNDFSQGSSTMSTGGFSATVQRPEKRDVLAPGVLKFLQNARLYQMQVYTNKTNLIDCNIECESPYITKDQADAKFVEKYQDRVKPGAICVINDQNIVSFQDPNTVSFKSMDADRILDTDGQYKPIHDIDNLAFYGPDGDDATTHNEMIDYVSARKFYNPNFSYSAGDVVVTYDSNRNKLDYWRSNQDNNLNHDPILDNTSFFWWTPVVDNDLQAKTIWDPVNQVYKMINQFDAEYFGGLNKQQIYDAINASGTSWDPALRYRKGFVVIFVDSNNGLGWYESLQDDNTNHNPETETTWWKKLPTPIVDVNDIILQITPYLDQEITKKVDAEIQKYATQSVGEYEGTIFEFDDQGAFAAFIAKNPKLSANMFDDVPYDYYTKVETDYAYQQLDTRLQGIDTKINTNTQNITTNKNNIATNTRDINTIDTKLDGVINGLQNGNLINYTGEWSNTKTYNLAQAVTYQDKWYVSNLNNNTNHMPTGQSDTWWELLSEPGVSLTNYYNKQECDTRFGTLTQQQTNTANISDLTTNKADKTQLNDYYPKSQTYNRTEIDNKVNAIPKVKYKEIRFVKGEQFKVFNNGGMRFWGFSKSHGLNVRSIISTNVEMNTPYDLTVTTYLKINTVEIWVQNMSSSTDVGVEGILYIWYI